MSSVETIIVWENLSVNRLVVKNTSTGEEKVLHLTPEQEQNDSHFRDPVTGSLLKFYFVYDEIFSEMAISIQAFSWK